MAPFSSYYEIWVLALFNITRINQIVFWIIIYLFSLISRFNLINSGETFSLILLEWNGWQRWIMLWSKTQKLWHVTPFLHVSSGQVHNVGLVAFWQTHLHISRDTSIVCVCEREREMFGIRCFHNNRDLICEPGMGLHNMAYGYQNKQGDDNYLWK